MALPSLPQIQVPRLRGRRMRVGFEGHQGRAVLGEFSQGHEASIALHRKCGFVEIGTERQVGRKFGRWLDVVLMQKML